MGFLDIFKTKWSAGSMTPDDRKKVFFYLKRKTSYTAWKRESDAFDGFVAIIKKQFVEQPHAPGRMGGTDWGGQYRDALKGQVCYEKGLANLMRGDRTVWLYNERGILDDASLISSTWVINLVHGGHRGDLIHDGIYVPQMKAALERVENAGRDTGYMQSMMAEAPAREFWGEAMDCKLHNEAYPRSCDDGIKPLKLASTLRYPDPLPEVPVPEKEVLLRTGEIVPVFGIYEPQVKDGCMNYLLQDTPAPRLRYSGEDPRPVVWRLIWEDTRYLDGQIPPEERLYFSTDDEVKPVQAAVASDLVTSHSGEVCPQDGYWAVMDDINAKAAFKKGSKMPQYIGRDINWVWVSK